MEKKHIIITVIVYMISSTLSYSVFSFTGGDVAENINPNKREDVEIEPVEDYSNLDMLLEIDPNAPKDQPCPLNGKMYTQIEREAWEQKRPLAVMIENHPDSRPQSGLTRADVVFEAIAEGGITRMMGVYYCDAQRQDITLAPVRSARVYYINWAAGFNKPLYAHVGGANIAGDTDAIGLLADLGWRHENDLDQFGIPYPYFARNYNRLGREVATEHTMESSTQRLWDYAEKERGWTNTPPEQTYGEKVIAGQSWQEGYNSWIFEDEIGDQGEVSDISYEFWTGYSDYGVSWKYDSESDTYLRTMGDKQHKDLETEEIIAPKNVVVVLANEEGPINEKKHMIYQTSGSNKAIAFKHGQVHHLTWTRVDDQSQFQFKTNLGRDYEFARGKIWISVMSDTREIDYTGKE